MRCPYCSGDTEVADTRTIKDLNRTKRHRRCKTCGKRFKTIESVQLDMPKVVKHDGRRESFYPDKLRNAIELATAKRNISEQMISDLIASVEHRIGRLNKTEVESNLIGSFVMQELYKLDRVAYVRFASVYRKFQDVGAFRELLPEVEGATTHSQQLPLNFDEED